MAVPSFKNSGFETMPINFIKSVLLFSFKTSYILSRTFFDVPTGTVDFVTIIYLDNILFSKKIDGKTLFSFSTLRISLAKRSAALKTYFKSALPSSFGGVPTVMYITFDDFMEE